MKTLKYIVPVFLFATGSSMQLLAEDSIVNRNITVEREFKPIIKDAGKINSVPQTLEPKVEKVAAKYSDFNLPLNADYNIHTLPAAELQCEIKPDVKDGFARLGFGNHINTLADFAYPLIKNPETKLDFSINHLGTFNSKAHSTTKAALSFDQYFNTFDLYAGVGGGHEYLKYYGYNFNGSNSVVNLDTLNGSDSYLEQKLVSINRTAQNFTITELTNDSNNSNTFWRFNAFAGVRSLPLSKGIRYQAEMQYKMFDAKNGLTENLVHTKAGFDAQSDKNRLGLDLDMYNLSYQSNNPATLNYLDVYTVFTMNPYYSIERKNFEMRLGVKSSFSFVHGNPFNPSADIHAEWKAIPKYLSIYGGIIGGYHVNTMDEIFSENRYLYDDVRVKDTYSPYEFYAGLKVKPIYNLLLDGYIDYRRIDNQYFFVNKEYKCDTVSGANSTLFTNRFNVLYSEASQLKIGVRANYNLRNLVNVQFKGAYNGWEVTSEQYAWNKPKWEANLSTDFRINHDLSISATVFYEGERYAKLGNLLPIRMHDKVDINIGASYSYNDRFTAFVKVNNLINNPYQDFYGYDVQGFNSLVGVAFSF